MITQVLITFLVINSLVFLLLLGLFLAVMIKAKREINRRTRRR